MDGWIDGCVYYYPTGAAAPELLLPESFIISPKVLPLSLLTLITGSLDVAFALSHQVTYTLFPAAFISASIESTLGVLLRFVLFDHVLPPSVDALNITSPFLFGVFLSVNHTT